MRQAYYQRPVSPLRPLPYRRRSWIQILAIGGLLGSVALLGGGCSTVPNWLLAAGDQAMRRQEAREAPTRQLDALLKAQTTTTYCTQSCWLGNCTVTCETY